MINHAMPITARANPMVPSAKNMSEARPCAGVPRGSVSCMNLFQHSENRAELNVRPMTMRENVRPSNVGLPHATWQTGPPFEGPERPLRGALGVAAKWAGRRRRYSRGARLSDYSLMFLAAFTDFSEVP